MRTITHLLGDAAEYLLNFNSPRIPKERLHLPGPDVVDRLYAVSDRNNRVLSNLQRLVAHVVSAAPVIYPSFQWTKASSILAAPASPRTQITLIQRIS